MDELRRWYRGSLPASIDALKSARKTLPKTPSSLDSIRRIAHSLSVSAAAHGYPALGETARKVEEALPEDVVPRLDRLLSELDKVQGALGAGDVPAILVIENDVQMAGLLETILSGPDREILLAGSAGEALALLERQLASLIVLDLGLPDTDGRNFLMLLRERSSTAGVPVIILSGMGGSQPKTECFALGADAYFEKPLAPEVLKAAVSARLHKSVEHRREARQDALTGLPNRAAFLEAFRRVSALSARSREPASLALLDCDFLSRINGALGHVAGDAALRHAARAFAAALRRSDILARWGGDEFVLLFPDTPVAGARNALDKVMGSLAANPFRTRDGTPVPLSFSAGLVAVRADAEPEQTLGEADRCLFQAKSNGRGRVVGENEPAWRPANRVLLAEDDESVAYAVAASLRREGFEVTHCRDAAAVLQAAGAGGFSLCILDLRREAIGGHAMLAELRRLSGPQRLPVLMITPMGADEDVMRGFELGADDYLVKPFSAYELMTRIHSLLRH